jgi:DEAD_2
VKTGCPFFYGYQKKDDGGPSGKDDEMANFVSSKISWDVPLSVSDYTKVGQINNFCPYYLMKDRLKDADLCILPYNYVLDSDLRE